MNSLQMVMYFRLHSYYCDYNINTDIVLSETYLWHNINKRDTKDNHWGHEHRSKE